MNINNINITVFDNRLEKRIRKIRPIEAYIEQAENGKNTLSFTDLDEVLEKKQRVVVEERPKGEAPRLSIYTIEGIETNRNGEEISYTYFCEGLIYEMYNIYIDDRRFRESNARAVMDAIFKYTNFTYSFEDNNLGLKAINTSFYHTDCYTAFIDTLNQLGYYYEVKEDNNFSLKAHIIIRESHRLSNNRITYGKNLLNATRRIKEDSIVNVLYPYGNGQEIKDESGSGTGNYSRKIDISKAKKGNGSKYVMDADSIAKWGRHEATMDFDCDDVDELYELALHNLEFLKAPRVEYEVNVYSDGDLYKIGDMVIISDIELELLITAKVVEIKKDIISGEVSVKLGHYEDIGIKNKKEEDRKILSKLQNRINELASNFKPSEDGTSHVGINSVEGLQEILDKLELEIDYGKQTYITHSEITKIREEISEKIGAVGGYVYLDEGKGIVTYDKPKDDNPTQIVQMLGGAIRFANSKDKDGNWIFKTAINGDGINAESINANTLTTDLLKFGDVSLTQALKTLKVESEEDKKKIDDLSASQSEATTKINNKIDGIISSVGDIKNAQTADKQWLTEEFSRVSTTVEDKYNTAIKLNEEKVLDLETRITGGKIEISSVNTLKDSVNTLSESQATLAKDLETTKSEITATNLKFTNLSSDVESKLSALDLQFKESNEGVESRLSAVELDLKNSKEGFESKLSAYDVKFTDANNNLASSLSALDLKFTNANEGMTTTINSQGVDILNLKNSDAKNSNAITRIKAGMAMFLKEDDLGRYGSTVIDGGRIKTGMISSKDGSTWINLSNGEFNFKDKLKFGSYKSYGEKYKSDLVLKGALNSVSSDGETLIAENYIIQRGKKSFRSAFITDNEGLHIFTENSNLNISSGFTVKLLASHIKLVGKIVNDAGPGFTVEQLYNWIDEATDKLGITRVYNQVG